MAKATAPKLHLAVQFATAVDGLPSRQRIRHWAVAACPAHAEVTIRFVDAEEGRTLNADYRGNDHATNVLSFPYQDQNPLLGDLVICVPVVAREAADQDKDFTAHCAHLIVHGMLHLQGYDHETGAADAERMEAREREILAGLGFPDPYI